MTWPSSSCCCISSAWEATCSRADGASISSRHRLRLRRHYCLRLQLIAERPKVLKLSKRGLERQGRPSRGTPTPPGYGYLTRHLPCKATHARLRGSANRHASLIARNEEETRLHAQIPKCSGLSSRKEQNTHTQGTITNGTPVPLPCV
jgi:hypothetical protein